MSHKLLFLANSIGYRTPERVGTKFLPLRLRKIDNGYWPWILYPYSKHCCRIYKSGFTVVDALLSLEYLNVNEFSHCIINLGIVEAWNREKLKNNFNDEKDKLLLITKGTKWHKILSEYYISSKNKTLFDDELFKQLFDELIKKLSSIPNITVIVHDASLYKLYSQENVQRINNIMLNGEKKYNYKVLYLSKNEVTLFDNVHLDFKSHECIINKLLLILDIQKTKFSWVDKIYEYIKFSQINKNLKLESSILEQLRSKLK